MWCLNIHLKTRPWVLNAQIFLTKVPKAPPMNKNMKEAENIHLDQTEDIYTIN